MSYLAYTESSVANTTLQLPIIVLEYCLLFSHFHNQPGSWKTRADLMVKPGIKPGTSMRKLDEKIKWLRDSKASTIEV